MYHYISIIDVLSISLLSTQSSNYNIYYLSIYKTYIHKINNEKLIKYIVIVLLLFKFKE